MAKIHPPFSQLNAVQYLSALAPVVATLDKIAFSSRQSEIVRTFVRACFAIVERRFFSAMRKGKSCRSGQGGYCSRCAPVQSCEIDAPSIEETSAPAPTLEELERYLFGELSIEFELDAATLEAIESPTLAEEIASINARVKGAILN